MANYPALIDPVLKRNRLFRFLAFFRESVSKILDRLLSKSHTKIPSDVPALTSYRINALLPSCTIGQGKSPPRWVGIVRKRERERSSGVRTGKQGPSRLQGGSGYQAEFSRFSERFSDVMTTPGASSMVVHVRGPFYEPFPPTPLLSISVFCVTIEDFAVRLMAPIDSVNSEQATASDSCSAGSARLIPTFDGSHRPK